MRRSRLEPYRLPFALLAALLVALAVHAVHERAGAYLVLGVWASLGVSSGVTYFRLVDALERELPEVVEERGLVPLGVFMAPRRVFRVADDPRVEADPVLRSLSLKYQWLYLATWIAALVFLLVWSTM